MHNHHLLQISDRPQWLTIKKGGKIYIDSVMEKVKPENVHLSTPVTQVERRVGKVAVTFSGGEQEFDHVIFATHADTSLEILSNPTALEKDILGSFEFSKNVATLHSDLAVTPIRYEIDIS